MYAKDIVPYVSTLHYITDVSAIHGYFVLIAAPTRTHASYRKFTIYNIPTRKPFNIIILATQYTYEVKHFTMSTRIIVVFSSYLLGHFFTPSVQYFLFFFSFSLYYITITSYHAYVIRLLFLLLLKCIFFFHPLVTTVQL